jgi:hypothetical protein
MSLRTEEMYNRPDNYNEKTWISHNIWSELQDKQINIMKHQNTHYIQYIPFKN